MDKFYNGFCDIIIRICKFLLCAEIVIAAIVVITRYLPGVVVPTWSEETILTCMIYMAMLSAAIGLRKNAHIRMTALDKVMPEKMVWALDIFGCLVVSAFAVVMCVEGWKFALNMGGKGYYASMPWLSKFWLYLPVPLSGVVTVIFEMEQIYKLFRAGKEKL